MLYTLHNLSKTTRDEVEGQMGNSEQIYMYGLCVLSPLHHAQQGPLEKQVRSVQNN
jgi:hypothetical protein